MSILLLVEDKEVGEDEKTHVAAELCPSPPYEA